MILIFFGISGSTGTIEIGDEYQELFEEYGGEKVQLVESLNSSETFVKGLKEMILKRSI